MPRQDKGVTEEAQILISEVKYHQKLTRVSPESTSNREMRLCPSLRSSYRSVMCRWAWKERKETSFISIDAYRDIIFSFRLP